MAFTGYRAPRSAGGGSYNGYSAPRAKQAWEQGDTVNVGFVKGLEVVAKIATPGDGRPDAFALWQPATGRFYQFVPHCGLSRCETLAEAMIV